ncbi:MAG: exo-alpha-sialidase [Clostridia bacterium]|nr:exo-alpha-sialidase [Clostridia bacterium]
MDWRNIETGMEIPSLHYSDQPFVIKNNENILLCCMTTGIGDEGVSGQKVMTMRSSDLGKTWKEMRSMEEDGAPENSYSVLLKTSFGRVYCFYNFNKDNIRRVKADNPPFTDGYCYRVDSLGYYAFRYSDDFGLTWSKDRYYVPIRNFEIDEKNVFHGDIQFFWNVGKPLIDGNIAYLSIHKVGGLGEGFFKSSEGVLVKSTNIMTESDVTKLQFETLPEGNIGIRTPEGGGPIAEEHSYVLLDDGSIFVVFRTIDGRSACAYSRDKGKTFEPSEYMPVKHPRAANFIWKMENGRYLYWFHNHGGKWYQGRNPAWCLVGIEEKGHIRWSQPEILLYHDDPIIRMSYPDFIEIDGKYLATETEKDKARIHVIDHAFMKKIISFDDMNEVCKENLVFETSEKEIELPEFKPFSGMNVHEINRCTEDFRTGITIDMTIRYNHRDFILLDTFTVDEQGIRIEIIDNQVRFMMGDGQYISIWNSDKNSLKKGKNQITLIIDGGPKVIYYVINGRFNDGKEKQYGFGRFSDKFSHMNGNRNITLHDRVEKVRIYDRAILTCEAVGNYIHECYNSK